MINEEVYGADFKARVVQYANESSVGLATHHFKGTKGRTVVLEERVVRRWVQEHKANHQWGKRGRPESIAIDEELAGVVFTFTSPACMYIAFLC